MREWRDRHRRERAEARLRLQQIETEIDNILNDFPSLQRPHSLRTPPQRAARRLGTSCVHSVGATTRRVLPSIRVH